MVDERPAPDDDARHAFRQALAMWSAKQWSDATKAFGEIALAYPHEDVGVVSAMLYLHGLNTLGSRIESPRPGCYDELAERLPALQRLYCEHGENRRHPRECHTLFRIERDLERGESGVPQKSAEAPAILYARGGERYLALAGRCVETALLAGVSPLEDHCDEYAFYAVRAFLQVPDAARAEMARALLLSPANGMLKSRYIGALERLSKE
jgi:hypothetical protein